MKAPAPTITVQATGRTGEVAIGIGSIPADVRIYYSTDNLTAGGEWTTGPKFKGPGFYSMQGLNDYVWYNFIGVVEHAGAAISVQSNVAKAMPTPNTPFCSVDVYSQTQTRVVEGRTFAFRLRMETRNPRNIPAEIFLYRRETFSPTVNLTRDVFTAVCKVGDLTKFPADAPAAGSPFFRLGYVDLIEREQVGPYLLQGYIQDDVAELVHTINLDNEYAEGVTT